MKKLFIPVVALTLSVAAHAEPGFHVGAQIGSAEPLVSDSTAAVVVTTGATGTTATGISQPYDRHTPITLNFGYNTGKSDFSATIFATSKTSTDSARNSNSDLQFVIGDATGLDFETKLKALLIDVDWSHKLAQVDNTSVNWSVGLRFGSVESESNTRSYDVPGLTPQFDFKVKGVSDLLGITAGLDSTTMLTDRWYFSARVKLGFVDGKVERTVDVFDLTPPANGGLTIRYEDEHRALLQTEAAIKVGMKVFAGFDAYLGYEYRNLDRESARAGGLDTAPGIGILFPQTNGFGLSGYILGANYNF